MKYLAVEPNQTIVTRIIDVESYREALADVDINFSGVDFATICRNPDGSGLQIIVYEWSLLEPRGDWWRIGPQLYNGNAVISAFNYDGETIDYEPHMSAKLDIEYIGASIEDVERAIAAKQVTRPYNAINGNKV